VTQPNSWQDLTQAQRREVEALARKGQRHPSRGVARVAYDWAIESGGEGGFLSLVGTGLAAAIDVAFGGGSKAVAELRLARRIARLGPPDAA
jgi:hypothetical protein